MNNLLVKLIVGFFGTVLALAFIGAFAVAGVFLNGWVLATLWGWFVVGTFGLPALGVLKAFGLMLLIRFLTVIPDTDRWTNLSKLDKDEQMKRSLVTFLTLALYPLLTLGIGWIVHQFV
jgi:hypothetical protein